MADLLQNLTAFEKYSSECENLNEKDAEIHARLAHLTGCARTIMEEALTELVEHETSNSNLLPNL